MYSVALFASFEDIMRPNVLNNLFKTTQNAVIMTHPESFGLEDIRFRASREELYVEELRVSTRENMFFSLF